MSVDPAAAAEAALVISALQISNLIAYVDFAAGTLFVYDYLLTIGMEVDLVWNSKWSFMKVLFLIQRYMPFIDTVILQPQMGRSFISCKVIYAVSGWMFIIGIAVSELILTLRTWAVWRKDARLSYTLPVFYVATWSSNLVVMGLFLRTETFGVSPDPNFVGCFLTGGSPIVSWCWIILIIYEAVILILMIVPGVKAFRQGGNSALYSAVYRDGLLYYIYLFALSTVNVIIILTLPQPYISLLSDMERVLHSIFTSRVILHIRSAGSIPMRTQEHSTILTVDIERSLAAQSRDYSRTHNLT